MTRNFDLDRTLEEWLIEGPSQLPDRAIDGIVRQLDTTSQRKHRWLPGREEMNRVIFALGGAAAVVVVAALALGLYSNQQPGVGGPPALSPSATPMPSPNGAVAPSPEPTVAPSPTASPRPAAEGDLPAGTYIVEPLKVAGNPLTVTFSVPSGWTWLAGTVLTSTDVGIQFEDVTSLNGDPCAWSGTADDVSVGTTVDDLVDAVLAQTAYEISEPVDVTIGGYTGRRVDIVHPAEAFTPGTDQAPGCDDSNYRIWSTAVHGPHPLYGGPDNRWQANVLDVEGTRLVVVAMDFPGASPAARAEMDSVIESLVIEP